MANNQENAAAIVKAPANAVTVQRTAGVMASAGIGPMIVQPVLDYVMQVVTALWPVIPVPSQAVLWSAATLICAIPAGILAWRVRGNSVQPTN